MIASAEPESTTARAPEPSYEPIEELKLRFVGPARLQLLGHGDLSTIVTTAGTGATMWNGLDIHRFREDAAVDAYGLFIYVRDLASGRLWSAGYAPTRQRADRYSVELRADKVTIRRRDGDIETVTEIAVSPEHAAEVRRVTVTNHGSSPREIEVTSFMEVVLAPRAADMAHRAFGDMFVETAALPEKSAMLARRRPRAPEERDVWLMQTLTDEEGSWSHFEYDCSRARFIGRDHTVASPEVLSRRAALANRAGDALDPAIILRKRAVLPAGGTARLALCTAVAMTRERATELVDTFQSRAVVRDTFALAAVASRAELERLGITAVMASRAQRLLSAVLLPHASLRGSLSASGLSGWARDALWSNGISGDLPILLIQIDGPDYGRLCREVLAAQELWRIRGIAVDLVILNRHSNGDLQPAQKRLLDIIAASPARERIKKPGGVVLLHANEIQAAHIPLLLASARVVLSASSGSLARQLSAAEHAPHDPVPQKVAPRNVDNREELPTSDEVLAFDNDHGGFANDGREYVIAVDGEKRTPAPWCNVIANERFGFVVSESGSGYTWSNNSQSHRLTPWSNDAVADPPGEAIYLTDDTTGEIWSATPLPAGGGRAYRIRHGQGYSVFEHLRGGISHELTLFVDPEASIKVMRLHLRNIDTKPRKLRACGVVEWVLGGVRERSGLTVTTEIDGPTSAVLAFNRWATYADKYAFFASTSHPLAATADREEFFGRYGSRERPVGLERVTLSGRAGAGLDPCAALLVDASLEPGETKDIVFLLGEASTRADALGVIADFRDSARIQRSLSNAIGEWETTLGALHVETPDPALDILVNRWLVYQVLSGRFWARSGFYQSGGAYGYRDQLQDVMALLVSRPEIVREHILRAARRQFVEGDVQHWWHPDTGEGVRTRCSDDMLWLPYVVAAYVETTGDDAVLDEQLPYLSERRLRDDEHDLFSSPPLSETTGSLYEHCTRAFDAGATEGPNGLPLMRDGDWNDGMNRVGGKTGESIWLAWFLAKTCRDFAKLAERKGNRARAAWCEERAQKIAKAAEAHTWDGQWYRRAYFDDGTPLGSLLSVECKIDAIAQSWAVISGVADPERARLANTKAIELLFGDRIMRLFTPPFEGNGPNPGYIQGYPAGIRENGGQYTHGALWTVLAEAVLGNGDRAFDLLSAMNPVHHGENPEACAKYAVEPYVMAADVYGGSNLVGRGGWTWYTGSAAWMYRIAVEAILGLQLRGTYVTLAPCIPRTWPKLEMDLRHRGTFLHIVLENPSGLSKGRCAVTVDRVPSADGRIPLDGQSHAVRAVLVQAP